MNPYLFPPDASSLQHIVEQLQHTSIEGKIKTVQRERLSDLRNIIASIDYDIQQRYQLHHSILGNLEKSIIRIHNEITANKEQLLKYSPHHFNRKEREHDLTLIEIEKVREQQQAFKDILGLKNQLRYHILQYKDLRRNIQLIPDQFFNKEIIQDLKPIIGEPAHFLQLHYDVKTQETILLQPPLEPAVPTPPSNLGKGEFKIGDVIYDDKKLYSFHLSRENINKHILVVGETGAGKTNLNYVLLLQVMHKLPCLIFDFKRDYRYLSKHRNISVIKWEQLQFNPLKPPKNVRAIEWLQTFADVFSQDSALLLGSKGFLLEQLAYLSKHFKEDFPSLQDLLTLLNALKFTSMQREASYLAVVKNRLKTLSIELPNIIKCREGIDIGTLLNRNIVIELDGLGIEAQNFIISILLTWIYLYRMAQNERGKLKHVIVFDEAKRIFDVNKERRPIEGIPNIDILTSRVREFGEALIVSDQEFSKLTRSIIANSFIKIIFHLGSGNDIKNAAESIGLERKDFIHKLRVGEAIVKVGNLQPFLIQVPFADVEKNSKIEIVDLGIASDFSNEDKLPEVEREFLEDVNKFPVSSVTERYRRLKLNSSRGDRIKRKLVEAGLVKEKGTVDGRKIVLLELTEKGALILGLNPRKSWRQGGVEHQYWVKKVAEDYRQKGYHVEEEVSIGEGKTVDIVAEKDGKQIAIEVETGKSNVEKNIRNCLEAGFDEIKCIAVNEKARRRTRGFEKF